MTTATTTPRTADAPTGVTTRSRPAPRHKPRADRVYLWFLLPTLVLFTLSITMPAVMGIFYSFTDSVGFGEFNFVGLNNYLVMFSDPAILSSYGFTIGVALCTVILVNVVALTLAIGLTSKIRAKTALRTIFVMPMVVSGIIIAFVFQFIFANTVPAAAQALQLGVLEESILADPDLAWISIVLVTAWQAVPQAMLIYIAGLMTVPRDVYEASAIDGASAWKQLRSITLPLISGFVLINVIIGFKDFLGTYEIIVGLTDGGPGTSTRSVAMTIFSGFDNGDYAYQMANSTIFFLITLTIALIQLRLTRGNARI
ncbi:carbohydrate ABC transporter permease [Nesterenkonia sandarakina]|uniref:Raffinose/stachyose/melibiose transport system permease protein n=1 Tax=Nesterenkonia sandarakina TaxID=272918 RepID=A0A7Z0J4P7_9MICC|nr:sugar ABC transporter permease [Nesterenkonia sandarakina]NYJ18038.1 raffinose/stachyose/melibiose transport system permease protein [Nesterenkonia sandarakina]